MKLFGIEISRRKKQQVAEEPRHLYDEIKIQQVNISSKPISHIPLVPPSTMTFAMTRGLGRTHFLPPEYDLNEIGKLEDCESFVRQAFQKKLGLMFKEGVGYTGADKQTLQYIKVRMAQMSRASGIPTIELLKRLAHSLIRTSNAYLVKVRNEKASGGRVRRDINKKRSLKPVAAYFPAAPETMSVRLNESGQIVEWKHELPDGSYKVFPPQDVIHFVLDRREGFLFGVPSIIPVIDDIRALRQIEENIEMLLYQHLFPLFQYKVGTETRPAGFTEDGTKETDAVRDELRSMPLEGGIVTPERHEIKAVGSEGRAIRAEGYLEHFKKRVIAGLGISTVDLGDGATTNRATATSMSRALIDSIKGTQDTFEAQWDQEVISELLLESTFGDDVLEEIHMVHLNFAEIDIANRMDIEKHLIELFEANGITYDEFRSALHYEPIPIPMTGEEQDPQKYPEWHNTYWKLFGEPLNLIRAVDEPYCYDQTTEILTNNGWKSFREVSCEDQVAVLYNGNELRFEKPVQKVEFDYSGQLYHLSTRFVDVLVTPNHKLYTAGVEHDRNPDLHPFRLVRADSTIGQYKKFKRTADWTGNSPTYFTLPELHRISKFHPDKRYFPKRDIPIKLWLSFLAWHITEGWYGQHGQMGIAQSETVHPTEYRDITNILQALELSYHPDDKGWTFSDFQIKEWLLKHCGHYCWGKYIPQEIKNLSSDLLLFFLKTMMHGDGEEVYHYLYSTTSKQLADDVQEVALKVGWAANTRVEKRLPPFRDCYKVAINRGRYADVADRVTYKDLAPSSKEELVKYTGKVYCVTTSTGVIYVRRNGKARWCGNSAASQAMAEARSTALVQRQLQVAQQGKEKEAQQKAEQDKQTKLALQKAKSKTQDHYLETAYRSFGRELVDNIQQAWEERKTFDFDYLKSYARTWAQYTSQKFKVTAESSLRQGYQDNSSGPYYEPATLHEARNQVDERAEYFITRLALNAVSLIQRRLQKINAVNPENILSQYLDETQLALDSLAYRADLIYRTEIEKAYNFGKLLAYRNEGVTTVEIVPLATACDKCKAAASKTYQVRDIDLASIVPLHPNCHCQLMRVEAHE